VRFTLPYEAFALFDVEAALERPSASRAKVGRNDPCPCGSGRKYKKCHLAADQAQRASERETRQEHDLDAELAHELSAYAMARHGSDWRRFTRDFADSEETLQLAVPWSLYHYRVQGQTVLEAYMAEHGRELSRAERSWLSAQQEAWLSVWEVIGVEVGRSLTLQDLLSGEVRCVQEVSGSQSVVMRDALLGRVVDHEGVSLLCGSHPRLLSPTDTVEVVRRAKGRLRRKRAVPVERLRDEAFGRYLIRRWEEALRARDLRAAIPPQLQNTDGDPLLLTTDHFALDPGVRTEVESCLAAMEGVEVEDAAADAEASGPVYVFLTAGNRVHAHLENTVVGRARLVDAGLRLETNSRERADALRARVEAACRGLLRHRAREHSDPLSPAVREARPAAPPEPPPPEAEEAVLDLKRRYYAAWPDEAVPALGGLSPREAVRTAQGRNAVDVLLKDMENQEHRFAGQSPFDFSELRRELNLE